MGKTKQNRITAKDIHKRGKRRCKMILLREKYRKDGKGKMQISQGGVTRPPSQFESYSLSASSKSYSDGFVFWGSLNTTIRTLLNYIYIHMFLAWFGPCLWPYLACDFCVIWPMCCCLIWSMILAWFGPCFWPDFMICRSQAISNIVIPLRPSLASILFEITLSQKCVGYT